MKKWMISVWCVLALLGCQKDESNNATASAPASAPVSAASGVNQNLPKYRVAVELNAPFAIQMSDGGVSGFDFDLLQKIAERQGFTLEFVPYPVESLLHILEKGEADLMAGGIYSQLK